MYFKNKQHEGNFLELVEQMYLSQEEREKPGLLLRRQLAFCYLVALYQQDYEKYEGERFYIEIGEELSLGGPTYLLEDKIGERIYAHEKILPAASQILRGEMPLLQQETDAEAKYIKEAVKMLQ